MALAPNNPLANYGSVPTTTPMGNALGQMGVGNQGTFSLDNLLGSQNQPGLLSQGAGALGSLFNVYGGLQQLGMAKDALKSQQAFANANLANQAQTVNTQLEDRQRARLGAQGITGNSPELQQYMANNQVKGTV